MNFPLKLSNRKSDFTLTLGYLNSALNNLATVLWYFPVPNLCLSLGNFEQYDCWNLHEFICRKTVLQMSFASPFTLQHHATVYLDLKDVLVKGSLICGLRACMIFSALPIELLGGHEYACTCSLCPCKSAMFLSQNFDVFFYKIFVRPGRLIYMDIKEMWLVPFKWERPQNVRW